MTSRVVLVTGGNRGIGLSIAREFQRRGDTVVVSHRSGSAPDGLNGVIMDVTDSASVDAAFKEIEAKFGSVDVLVANAGITKDGLAVRMSEADFLDVVNTNLVIAPGFVETDMTSVLSDDLRAKYVAQIPLGRFCSPEEIAGVATFLSDQAAGYITGAVIPVDGGLGMGH
mgnify:CR=1 FL=1